MRAIFPFIYLLFPLGLFAPLTYAKTVRYTLTVENQPVNMSGKKTVDFALVVNGGIPAPTLEFTEGDDAEITVQNKVPGQEVSIHWHGLLLPPSEDGVAYVNTPPIFSGQSRTFKFKIRQHGTYWYHSHTMLQEQKGVFGAFIIHPKKPEVQYDKDVVVVLSDWSDENADSILAHLRKDGDYYQYKKDSIRSYWGAIQAHGLKTMLTNEWIRMGGMDLSDVGYDAFLINGLKEAKLGDLRPGQKARIRIINAAASTYFYVSLGGLPMQVISADGTDIKPQQTNELLMGMAETYDILFSPPEAKSYELRATAQDVTGAASAWIGSGPRVLAATKAQPDLYAGMSHDHGGGHDMHAMPMDHSGQGEHDMSHMDHMQHMNHGEHADHGASAVLPTLTVDDLEAKASTEIRSSRPTHDVKLVLDGDMKRYVWHINGKAIFEDRNIIIRAGDVVRFTLVNQTMMHHPMHLHGHFFRVLTAKGALSPMKHTVDVPPHGTRTIEFKADEPGEWMLHCHNLYHMKTGMARVVKYADYIPASDVAKWQAQDHHMHDHGYTTGMLEASTNHSRADLHYMKTWSTLELHLEGRDYDRLQEIQGNLYYRLWYSRFLNVFAGGVRFYDYGKDKNRVVVGVGYTLPMLIDTNLMVDHEGEFRLDLTRKFQWTKNVFTDLDISLRQNHDPEFEVSLMYSPRWEWAAGLMVTEDRAGAGFQYRF